MARRAYWRWQGPRLDPRGWLRALRAWRRLSAPRLFVLSFAALIAVGTGGLLWIPGLQRGAPLSFVDALFTITSATCVTGLTVVDTGTHFTRAGQAWILLFIQLGGIGVITLTTMLIGALGQRLSLRSEMLTMAPPRREGRPEVWQVAYRVARFTLGVELVGALLLVFVWWPRFEAPEAAWHALFHAVSAYCNAGFSTFPDNLMAFRDSPLTLLVLSGLIVTGGIGYLAFEELLLVWRTSRRQRTGVRIRLAGAHRLSSHTWAVVVTSLALLAGGWLLFSIFEWSDTLAGLATIDKLAGSLFMAVTCRTAGFNAIDYSAVANDTAALTMLLMFIGGSPGSTAGGIKTSTVAVLVALGLSRLRGRRFVGLRDRAIPERTIEATVGIILLSILVLGVAFFTLSAIESAGVAPAQARAEFLPLAFETVSALSTTGLSMSLTPTLTSASKLVLVLLMFIGRVGLLSFFTAVTLRRAQPPAYQRPAQEDVIVG
jgi:trk system potassium uptake protein TrkH